MEICISKLRNADLYPCYGSPATHGERAMATTWEVAQRTGKDFACLDSVEKLEAVRAHLKSMGMDETETMSEDDLQGMLVQLVASELRDNDCVDLSDLTEGGCENIFIGTDGEYYFYCGF